jgi:hypothetical protein
VGVYYRFGKYSAKLRAPCSKISFWLTIFQEKGVPCYPENPLWKTMMLSQLMIDVRDVSDWSKVEQFSPLRSDSAQWCSGNKEWYIPGLLVFTMGRKNVLIQEPGCTSKGNRFPRRVELSCT